MANIHRSLDAVTTVNSKLTLSEQVSLSPESLACLAAKALIQEVLLSPKPGLVDSLNTGAHSDMTVTNFIDSAFTLLPHFQSYVSAGIEAAYNDMTLEQLFHMIRQQGQSAEQAMFNATAGINTHKGANFSFALVLAGIGYMVEKHSLKSWHREHTQLLLTLIQRMTQDILLKDFEGLSFKQSLTHGERLYLDYGIKGIRGEAASGYPTLRQHVLPFIDTLAHPLQEADWLRVLLVIMAQLEDGNVLHRGGLQAQIWLKDSAIQLLNPAMSDTTLLDSLQELDSQCIAKHISPGGAADMLALSMFLTWLEQQR